MADRKVRKSFERTRLQTAVGSDSKTKQSFKDDCDINVMIKRHRKTGIWENVAPRAPTYGDFSHAQDLHAAMDRVMTADAEFMALPSEVRNLCDNDPERLLRALASPEETAALFDAGLPMAEGYKPWREPPPEKPLEEAVKEAIEEIRETLKREETPPVIKGGE